ncbi:unnamed protein product [Spirodela intermedia]|uniref:Uncharacterized protein n=1 Tax=Spirodela intermedia TaxID=51605 RepID=A0A7I8IMJ3_SPIIN|nr:unnamed protein product [Spirodela intermedia]CAA6658181.1 unnamed protein product [Spirodela intermedia]
MVSIQFLLCCSLVAILLALPAGAEDPYKFFTWNVTYGDIWPLGVKQQGILINGQFPGPQIDAVTNDNLIINVFNSLGEPFLISWSECIQQRRNSWQDGVYGTTCPIPPGRNFTYVLQVKDQIGSYYYFPSLAFHKAPPDDPRPLPSACRDFTVLAGDWFKANHTSLKAILDSGRNLPYPDGLLINGRGWNGNTFTVDQGRTYRFRISNVGLTQSINIRFEGHSMKLVEVEGSHTLQNTYSSLDVHLGQSYSVLVTADQPVRDYYIVVSSRFSTRCSQPQRRTPGGPTIQIDYSLNQARSIRWNLTASGPRPNPQGSYHYGMINTTRTIRLANSAPVINGKQRYAVNSIADFYKIPGVFSLGSIPDNPTFGGGYLQTSVMAANFRNYVEIVFENYENTVQSWHIDGYAFFVVGNSLTLRALQLSHPFFSSIHSPSSSPVLMDGGQWSSASRKGYNLRDTVARSTVQVYPNSWTAIYMALDNVGMWNIRSENWARQYLGQQFYLRVFSPANSWRTSTPSQERPPLRARQGPPDQAPLRDSSGYTHAHSLSISFSSGSSARAAFLLCLFGRGTMPKLSNNRGFSLSLSLSLSLSISLSLFLSPLVTQL